MFKWFLSNRSLKYVEIADSSLSWRNSQVLKLFPLHKQHRVKKDLFELVLWMQNNTKNQKEKKIMPGRGRGIVGSEKGRRSKRKEGECVLDCAFCLFVCFFPLTHVEPMKAYFCHGI